MWAWPVSIKHSYDAAREGVTAFYRLLFVIFCRIKIALKTCICCLFCLFYFIILNKLARNLSDRVFALFASSVRWSYTQCILHLGIPKVFFTLWKILLTFNFGMQWNAEHLLNKKCNVTTIITPSWLWPRRSLFSVRRIRTGLHPSSVRKSSPLPCKIIPRRISATNWAVVTSVWINYTIVWRRIFPPCSLLT